MNRDDSKTSSWRWLLLLALLATGCRAGLAMTPREATRAAQAEAGTSPTATAVLSTAPTPTGIPLAPTATPLAREANPRLTLWVNETSPAHRAALAEIAAGFAAANDVNVEVIHVAPRMLPRLVNTAVLSGTLPDLVIHPLEYTVGWEARGILDAAAAAEVVERLGPETFEPESLALATVARGLTAVPSDGYKQLILYRTDWFAERDLAPPDSYERILTAAATIYFTPTLTAGLVVPTESDLITTQHVFEQIATANGCRLIDDKGEVTIQAPACQEAMEFYRQIVNRYSPSDVQTDISALNAYLAGRTGLIIAAPSVLPQLAGLDPLFPPTCPECDDSRFLAERTGIITDLAGGQSDTATTATFGEVNYLGITTAADRATAVAFAEYWFDEAYLTWLAVDSARKVPMRRGTPDAPRQYLDAWGALPLAPGGPSLSDLFGPEIVAQLSDDVATSDRWGFIAGQGTLIERLYQELTFSILLQEMLSGYFTSEQAISQAYARVTALIPDYPFYPTPEPTATPEP